MTVSPAMDAPSIRVDEHGVWRVGKSRVLAELVINAFERGATPEGICQSYPSASLADIYGVIAYYLGHKDRQFINCRIHWGMAR